MERKGNFFNKIVERFRVERKRIQPFFNDKILKII